MLIGTPSIETNDLALAIGTAGHVIERAIFANLRRVGVDHEWRKDEVLFALQDIALLMHAENIVFDGQDSLLFRWFTFPPSIHQGGGLGWRKDSQVRDFIKGLKQKGGERKVKTVPVSIIVSEDELVSAEALIREFGLKIALVVGAGSKIVVGTADGMIKVEEGRVGIEMVMPKDLDNDALFDCWIKLSELMGPAGFIIRGLV